MMLEIQELGLGTTWIGSFNPAKVREIYEIPENLEIVAILPVGYPAEEAKPSEAHDRRNAMDEMVYWDTIK